MRAESACDAVTAALIVGEAPDPGHLAECPRCRERVRLVGALGGAPRVGEAPVPTVAGLRAAARARVARRVGVVTVAALAAAAVLALRAPADVVASDEVLVAALDSALDDAEQALAPPELPGEDLLALVDPLADDLADEPPDPLFDALLGEGSL